MTNSGVVSSIQYKSYFKKAMFKGFVTSLQPWYLYSSVNCFRGFSFTGAETKKYIWKRAEAGLYVEVNSNFRRVSIGLPKVYQAGTKRKRFPQRSYSMKRLWTFVL